MTDWIEHDGGPQPVADDVWVESVQRYGSSIMAPSPPKPARHVAWNASNVTHFRVLNQHLIDAARLEGIRLGLEAAAQEAGRYANELKTSGLPATARYFEQHRENIRDLDPVTIAKEADQ